MNEFFSLLIATKSWHYSRELWFGVTHRFFSLGVLSAAIASHCVPYYANSAFDQGITLRLKHFNRTTSLNRQIIAFFADSTFSQVDYLFARRSRVILPLEEHRSIRTASKLSMRILSELPAEIWACISSRIPGEQLLRLKMTGSKFLWARICDPRAVYAVSLGRDILNFKRWPACLNELPQVQDLSIRPRFINFTLPTLHIPRTVRKLEIFSSASNALIPSLSRSLQCFSFTEHLPQLEFLSLDLNWTDLTAKGATFPSTFTSLRCLNCDLRELPPTIVHLEVNGVLSVQSFENLPNLETLSATEIVSPSPLPSLPISLRSFHIESEFSRLVLSPFIEQLPQALTKLGDVCFPDSTSDLLLNLPPGLTELVIQDPPVDHLSHLPSALKTLRLKFRRTSPSIITKTLIIIANNRTQDFQVFSMSILPQSLTHLEVMCVDECYLELPLPKPSPDSPTPPAQWPPSLTFLELSGVLLSRTALQQLPPSLESFCVEKLQSDMFELLPRGLTFLECFATTGSSEYLKFLPRSLTRLKLRHCLLNHWIDPTDREISPVSQKQTATACNTTSACITLPANIRYLLLAGYPNLEDSSFLPRYRGMESLLLVTSPNLTDAVVPLFPRYLTHLNLHQSKKITGGSFKFLPKELRKLSLDASTEIYDADIKHLPRTLEQLHLQSAVYLTDSCIPEMPQQLERLDITQNKLVTSSVFSLLPYPIRCLYLSHTFTAATWHVSIGTVYKMRQKSQVSDPETAIVSAGDLK